MIYDKLLVEKQARRIQTLEQAIDQATRSLDYIASKSGEPGIREWVQGAALNLRAIRRLEIR